MLLRNIVYDRTKAIDYTRKWALERNPAYLNFTGIGGDCANFASQCIYNGAGVMNYKPIYGWYYKSANDRAPAWSSVKYLYEFLISNAESGPYAVEIGINGVEPGDIIQIATYMPEFHHTLVVVETGDVPDIGNILICAHSYDSLDRPLSSYEITQMRCLHIKGVRK